MPSSNDILEEEANNCPWHVVHGGGGRNESRSREDDGEIDVFDERVWILARNEVACNGKERANEEEEDERVVYLAFRELEGGSDDTPLRHIIIVK